MTVSIIERSIHDFPTIQSMERTLLKQSQEQDVIPLAGPTVWELTNFDPETSIANPNDPVAEAQRLKVLVGYKNILNCSHRNSELDELVQKASEVCETPTAALNIIDLGLQWTKSIHGLNASSTSEVQREMSRNISFCAHTIRRRPECGVLVVPDTLDDARFEDNPIVWNMGIRFYAGVPIKSPEGAVLGALCVFDTQPHPEGLTIAQERQLLNLADCAMAAMLMTEDE